MLPEPCAPRPPAPRPARCARFLLLLLPRVLDALIVGEHCLGALRIITVVIVRSERPHRVKLVVLGHLSV